MTNAIVAVEYEYEPKNVTGDAAGRCNGLLENCRNPDCEYSYLSPRQKECPECGTVREYCLSFPLKGRDRCQYHGGNRAIGPGAGAHSGRGLSTILTSKFLDSYRAHYEDINILDMTSDIALLNMRRDALIEKWQERKVSQKQWEDLKTYHELLCDHVNQGHQNKINEMLYKLGKIIAEGYSDILLWQEITKIEEQITKIKDREIKRIKTASTVITEREFRQFFSFVLSIIDSRVKDDHLKNQILLDLQKLNN